MKRLLLFIFIVLTFSSCSKFQHMMKSTDMEAKYNAAVKYYEKKDYYHALQLFEELITVYRGTSKAEQSYFYYVYCTYYVDDFTMAAYHFNNFVQSYPNSSHAEEMQYMYAYCYYLDSPIPSLDQTSTIDAIDKFQIFINKFPESTRVADANKMMDELRAKLEEKTFNNAKLYYRTSDYNAAVVAFSNFQKDFPYSLYIEESMYLGLRASYEYATNSIDSKRVGRLKAAQEEYQKLVDSFGQSRYLREAERIFDNITKDLAQMNSAAKG